MPGDQEIDSQASVLMKRGIALMNNGGAEALDEALSCFDGAIRLREQLPIDTVPIYRYGLAACWLNRAEAQLRRGDAKRFPVALRDSDEGIRLLSGLPLTEDPRFLRRLAVGLQNRGMLLLSQRRFTEAVAAFDAAIETLSGGSASGITDREFLKAAGWLNLALAHGSEAGPESAGLAGDCALRAIGLVADIEASDVAAAEVGLKARHAMCRILAPRLAAINSDEVHRATDLVDDGLALVRQWEQKGVARFRQLAYDLFRFGALLYGQYQPHFLDEFVMDNIDPANSSTEYVESPEMCDAVLQLLANGMIGNT